MNRHSPLVDQIRRFDRFYEQCLRNAVRLSANEDLSVAEVRVLSELGWGAGGGCGAWLSGRLDIDAGYLSRVLRTLEAHQLVVSSDSLADARRRNWDLTPLGRQFAQGIEDEYRDRVLRMLLDVLPPDRDRLVEAMHVIEEVLHRTWLSSLA
jgi:DNA-binding MarR family transcriptional regulator